jgi:hypothetical protein
MFKKFALLIFFVSSVMAEEQMWFETEKIGDFSIGLSEKILKKKLRCAFQRGKDVFEEADALYHQYWNCSTAGIGFDMSSENKGGKKTIDKIVITSPSKLKTKRGIQIGYTEAQVIKAYHDVNDIEETVPKKLFIAGSVYGGLFFEFQNGRVVSIMLGAGAE